MTDRSPGMLVWTLRQWSKAQYAARALAVPDAAWDIPFLFAPLGGPEVSAFEAMDRPELGGLYTRLKAVARVTSAIAASDTWAHENVLRNGKLAAAFHPGLTDAALGEMSSADGYTVHRMPDVLATRPPAQVSEDLTGEGLADGHANLRVRWGLDGAREDDIVDRTLALPAARDPHSSAAQYLLAWVPELERLCARLEAGAVDDPAELLEALARLAIDGVQHPVVLAPFVRVLRSGLHDNLFTSATRALVDPTG